MKKVYKIEEVAEILAFREETVRKLLKKGRIKGVKLGTGWRITGDEIRRILGLQGDHKQEVEKDLQKDRSRAL